MVGSPKRNKVNSLVEDYFDHTRTSGLPAVYYSEGKFKKAAWIVIFLLLLGILLFNVFHILVEFFSYPVYLRVSDVRPTEVAFPSVTICSAGDYSRSSITEQTLKKVQLFVGRIEKGEIDVDTFLTWRSSMEHEHIESVHDAEFQHKSHSDSQTMLLKNLSGSCTFSTVRKCNYEHDFIKTFPSDEDKICYTFNHNKESLYYQRGNGPLFGLSMILFVNQSDYVPLMGFDNGVGLTVYIHPPNTYPFFGVHGISTPPGYSSSVAMHKIATTRLPSPYPSKCTDGKDVFQIIPGDYTVMGCEVSCQYYYIYRKCGYIEPFMRSFMPPELYPRNKSDDVQTMLRCRENVLSELFTRGFKEKCNCPDPCYEEVHHRMVSMTRWPALVDIPLYKILFSKSLNIDAQQVTEEYIRKNFLQLRVYFDELAYKHSHEQCKMSSAELFSNLGGQLGLWVGYSFFSIIEMIVLACTIIFVLFNCKQQSDRHAGYQTTANNNRN